MSQTKYKIADIFIDIVIIVGVAVASSLIALKVADRPIKAGGILGGTPTVSSVTVSPATSTAVLPRNVGREYAEICNSGSSDVFVTLTNTTSTAVTAKGRIVKSTYCYKIAEVEGNMWLGGIYAVASSTTSTLSILEK